MPTIHILHHTYHPLSPYARGRKILSHPTPVLRHEMQHPEMILEDLKEIPNRPRQAA